MISAELKYEWSKLDNTHTYYLEAATDGFSSWRWFYLGKYLTEKGSDFRLYPFHPSCHDRVKTILTCKVNFAPKQGEMIATRINSHYEKKSKK